MTDNIRNDIDIDKINELSADKNTVNVENTTEDSVTSKTNILDTIHFTFISLYEEDITNYKAVLTRSNVGFVCNDIIDEMSECDKYDAVVSPANSFGFMDRGVDACYVRYFQNSLEKSVKDVIRTKYHGELIVGNGMVLDLNRVENPRFLINCPTARVPSDISSTTNVYYACRALLTLLEKNAKTYFENGNEHGRIKHILVPCLGAGSGRMPSKRSAIQVKSAFDSFYAETSPTVDNIMNITTKLSWSAAKNNDSFLRTV